MKKRQSAHCHQAPPVLTPERQSRHGHDAPAQPVHPDGLLLAAGEKSSMQHRRSQDQRLVGTDHLHPAWQVRTKVRHSEADRQHQNGNGTALVQSCARLKMGKGREHQAKVDAHPLGKQVEGERVDLQDAEGIGVRCRGSR
jgi:hypothetical protein